jgi:hypothetical protein
MKVVAYAYFFALDFLINILYTILFASIWILIVSDSDNPSPIGSNTFDSVKDAKGFVDPLHTDAANIDIVTNPNPNPLKGLHASLLDETGNSMDPGSAGATFSSISIIFFWLIKIYFIIIVFSYARNLVIRSHISTATFSLQSSLWSRAQQKMLSGNYWKEDDDDYKTTSRRT